MRVLLLLVKDAKPLNSGIVRCVGIRLTFNVPVVVSVQTSAKRAHQAMSGYYRELQGHRS